MNKNSLRIYKDILLLFNKLFNIHFQLVHLQTVYSYFLNRLSDGSEKNN